MVAEVRPRARASFTHPAIGQASYLAGLSRRLFWFLRRLYLAMGSSLSKWRQTIYEGLSISPVSQFWTLLTRRHYI